MNPLRSVGARFALGIFTIVTGALGIVYLILVPSLEQRLVNSKLSQLDRSARVLVELLPREQYEWQRFVGDAASGTSLRIAVYEVDRRPRTATRLVADSHGGDSSDMIGNPVAQRTAESFRVTRDTVERAGTRFAEVAITTETGDVLLISTSLRDALGTVELVEERLLLGGVLALAAALLVGYGAASAFARRIRRLERAAGRIASGNFDEPVADAGSDELAQLASAFERMRVRLAQLDRARNEFIANASHELRTPLFALSGFLELFAEEELDDATRREFLVTMREQVDRLTRLATDLLDLSRIDAGHVHVDREPVDLAKLAEAVVGEFRGLAGKRERRLEAKLDGATPAVGDEQRVLQIGRILVENALLHTPPGTAVHVRAATQNGSGVLTVEDDGPGLAADEAAQIFERFYRAEGAVTAGSGLGLAIARELAELMGGSLRVESSPGKTAFSLELPSVAPRS